MTEKTLPLTRERIAAAGLELVDREGIGALSMRRLAAEVGVGTMTLYGYFRDKSDLVDALVDAVAESSPLPPPGGDWREQVARLMHHLKNALSTHPALAQLRASQPIATPGAFRLTEAGVAALLEAGFERAEAARHFRTLFIYTFGIAVFAPESRTTEAKQSVGAALAALPATEYPVLAGAIPELVASLDPGSQFEHGLDLMLDALEARLRDGPATTKRT